MSKPVRFALVLALVIAALFVFGLSALADQQGPGPNAPTAQVGHTA
jgi:hypothetical protein